MENAKISQEPIKIFTSLYHVSKILQTIIGIGKHCCLRKAWEIAHLQL